MDRWKHITIVTIIIAVLSVVVVWAFLTFSVVPAAAATQSVPIDHILRIGFAIGGVIFVLCMVFLVYNTIVFHRPASDTREGPPMEGIVSLEVIWTIIPLALVIWLSFYGAQVLGDITKAQENELQVNVVAFQWAWRFEYPQYGVTSNTELTLPVNRPVVFNLRSLDVIHGFWVPEFRIKMDLLPGTNLPGPGTDRVLRITPDKVGNYKLLCNQLCGLGHAIMTAPVNVVQPSDFDNWINAQKK